MCIIKVIRLQKGIVLLDVSYLVNALKDQQMLSIQKSIDNGKLPKSIDDVVGLEQKTLVENWT